MRLIRKGFSVVKVSLEVVFFVVYLYWFLYIFFERVCGYVLFFVNREGGVGIGDIGFYLVV